KHNGFTREVDLGDETLGGDDAVRRSRQTVRKELPCGHADQRIERVRQIGFAEVDNAGASKPAEYHDGADGGAERPEVAEDRLPESCPPVPDIQLPRELAP